MLYAGRVLTEDKVEAAVHPALGFPLTLGPEGAKCEHALANFLGVRQSLLVDSGSSAYPPTLVALTRPQFGDSRLRNGGEGITAAAGFPTAVSPIVQNRLLPVFIDSVRVTLNIHPEQLDEAHVAGQTRAAFLAHTLSNPFHLSAATAFCRTHDLWLIEDNDDSLGCRHDDTLTGTFGDYSTQHLYPPHHLVTGEGGAVNIVQDATLKILAERFRDWGRDCWCGSGKDNTCNKRFGWQLGELPRL